jgi:hypothetical protein
MTKKKKKKKSQTKIQKKIPEAEMHPKGIFEVDSDHHDSKT